MTDVGYCPGCGSRSLYEFVTAKQQVTVYETDEGRFSEGEEIPHIEGTDVIGCARCEWTGQLEDVPTGEP